MPLIVLGATAIAWAEGFTRVGVPTLVAIALLGALGWAADSVAGVLGARRAGASGWGLLGACVGLLIGLAFGLPGLVLGPALGAVALEYARDADFRRAATAGLGVFLGFIVGTAVKYAVACLMIGLVILAWLL